MKNWSTDIEKLGKNKEQFEAWKLEQLINFGLDGEKISEKELRLHWNILRLDPAKRRFISLLLQ